MFDWVHLSIPPAPALFAQLLVGLINGAFYAMLSLGLAIIFGLLNIINFTHGAQYMLGAFCAWLMLNTFGLGYWPALVLAPLVVGALGIAIEQLFLRPLYRFDPLYGLLLTFGLALVIWLTLTLTLVPLIFAITEEAAKQRALASAQLSRVVDEGRSIHAGR